jgi:hypothetical protein
LGLSLLICTGWLIGLRNAGSSGVMESTSVYWIPIFELLDERYKSRRQSVPLNRLCPAI